MKRAVFTGSRDWQWPIMIKDVIDSLDKETTIIVHGACSRGADQIANDYAKAKGFTVEKYKADWSHGRYGGPKRNKRMIRESIRQSGDGNVTVYAFIYEGPGSHAGTRSRGTRGCVEYAIEKGCRVVEFKPPK